MDGFKGDQACCAEALGRFLDLIRRDGQVDANTLIAEYGSLGALLDASRERLFAIVPPYAAHAIAVLREVVERSTALAADGRDVITDMPALLAHLRMRHGWADLEKFTVVYLDSGHGVIASELIALGTVDQCAVYPRAIVGRALELNAKGLILAHNHPSNMPEPSKADIRLTRTVGEAARLFEIHTHDHIIMTRSGYKSLRELGYI